MPAPKAPRAPTPNKANDAGSGAGVGVVTSETPANPVRPEVLLRMCMPKIVKPLPPLAPCSISSGDVKELKRRETSKLRLEMALDPEGPSTRNSNDPHPSSLPLPPEPSNREDEKWLRETKELDPNVLKPNASLLPKIPNEESKRWRHAASMFRLPSRFRR